MTMTAGAVRLAARYDRFVDRGPGALLTDRQYDVMRRLALGQTYDRIGHELGISRTTIKNHRQHALAAYDAPSTIDLFREMRWLTVPAPRLHGRRLRLVTWLEHHTEAIGTVLALATAALVGVAVVASGGPTWAAVGLGLIWYGLDPRRQPVSP